MSEDVKRFWVEKHHCVYDQEASFDLYDAETVVTKADHDAAIAVQRNRIEALEQKVKSLLAFKHSVEEAVNTGDGSYKP